MKPSRMTALSGHKIDFYIQTFIENRGYEDQLQMDLNFALFIGDMDGI